MTSTFWTSSLSTFVISDCSKVFEPLTKRARLVWWMLKQKRVWEVACGGSFSTYWYSLLNFRVLKAKRRSWNWPSTPSISPKLWNLQWREQAQDAGYSNKEQDEQVLAGNHSLPNHQSPLFHFRGLKARAAMLKLNFEIKMWKIWWWMVSILIYYSYR